MPNTLAVSGHTPNLGVRVLSLDGGGAGALSELLILERMMYRAKTEGRLDTIPSPCDCFEIIGGSGRGGIIALMLGRLHMSVADAISAYVTLRPQPKIGSAEQFRASKFETALKGIFQLHKMKDVSPDACKTFIWSRLLPVYSQSASFGDHGNFAPSNIVESLAHAHTIIGCPQRAKRVEQTYFTDFSKKKIAGPEKARDPKSQMSS
ncbi:hypothetical protein B0H14DRAFT_915502 [Mycena olivaceomarginata]|nr:hypothetical protein B0H14DRAFT_915502 [Mycena olivaceomarginata]